MKALMVGVWSCLMLTLMGCAVSREAVRSAYARAPICCDSLAQLQYEKLPSEGLKLFDVDEHSQMFVFDTGRSFALGIELPSLEPPFLVRIKSFALGDYIENRQIFYPVVLVLDAQYRSLSRELAPNEMQLSRADVSEAIAENRWGLGLKYQWDLLVDEPEARYLVVHTDARMLGSGEVRCVPRLMLVCLPGIVTVLPTGKERIEVIPYSAFGRISLQVQPVSSSTGSRQ